MEEIKLQNEETHFVKKSSDSSFVLYEEIFDEISPKSPLSTSHTPDCDSIDLEINENFDTSIEQLYHNVCDMQSSDQSPSMQSFLSYGEESRIDSELRFYAGGNYRNVEVTKEVVSENGNGSENKVKSRLGSAKSSSSDKSKKPPSGKVKPNVTFSLKKKNISTLCEKNVKNGDSLKANYTGSYLLKQSRDLISSGDNPQKALDLALRAMKSFNKFSTEKRNLELVMCLHIVAALYCKLGKYNIAIPILEKAIDIPIIDEGDNHALAKFAGCMQLGDTYAMIGQIENSIFFYTAGLEIQRQVLGEKDTQFGETCRYVSETHLQLFQFDEAEKLCQLALDIHREKGSSPTLQEAADRRLMGLIHDSKGNYETALEHYVLASMAMSANGHEKDVAFIDSSIGDAYLKLGRYDEAIFSYQKALNLLKSTKGENHPSTASVFVRFADLYNKIGKFRDSKTYCENALFIYSKSCPGIPTEVIASGFIELSAIYESMNQLEQALKLLQKAIKVYENVPGQQSMVAGIDAQMGVLYYLMGSYSESYYAFRDAISKFREIGEKKSALFGIALNQMGLACVQLYAINEAAELFEESRNILEIEYGPHHSETLGVYSNLAGTYDAMGRTSYAIGILEHVVEMREQKLGTANPDGDDEKRRLTELLKESGRVRNRKSRSLVTLLETNYRNFNENEIGEL